jgi:hypothetical protein
MAKKGRIFIVAVCFVLVGFPLWAEQEKQEPIDPQEVNAESAPMLLTPGELVDQAFEEFQQKKGIQFGAEGNDGKIYYAAKSVVNIPSTNSQWAKARVNAFESALLKTQKDFIIDMFGRQSVKKSQEIFDDQSDDAEVFPELDKSMSKLESIYEKLVALTGAKLDVALRKVNVDPEEFKSKPPEQRKTTFMSKMTKTMLTEAIGDSTGLMPIQTFEGNDEAGNHVMGVVTMYSSKLKQLAYDISHKRVPLLKRNTGKALKEQIPADAETAGHAWFLSVSGATTRPGTMYVRSSEGAKARRKMPSMRPTPPSLNFSMAISCSIVKGRKASIPRRRLSRTRMDLSGGKMWTRSSTRCTAP